jgi:hypothetical protein
MKRRQLPIRIVFITFVTLTLNLVISPIGRADDEEVEADHLLYLPLTMNNYDPGWLWQDSISLTLTPTPGAKLVTAIDHQGRLHVMWETSTSPRFIYHTFRTADGWTPSAPVATTLGTSYILYSPLVGDNGDLHLVWRNYLGSGVDKPYRLMYARFDGFQWQPEEEAYRTSNSTLQAIPHHDQDSNIRITLVDSALFSTTTHQLLRLNNIWQPMGVIQPGHSSQWVWPDKVGGIHFYGSAGNQMYYSYWRDGQFQIHNHQGPGTIGSRQTQLDAQNNLHTFWQGSVPVPGGTVTGLSYQCLQSNLTWQTQEVLSGFNAVSGAMSKAADTVSRVTIAWKESSPPLFYLGIWDGCNKLSQKLIPITEPNQWELKAMALSRTPQKSCTLFRRSFNSTLYTAVCADISWQ